MITLHNMPLTDFYSPICVGVVVTRAMTWPTSTYTVTLFREQPFMIMLSICNRKAL